jgi:hypothetical protein
MTRDSERDYVRRWVETGRLLDDLRWRELKVLGHAAALEAYAAPTSSIVRATRHRPSRFRQISR